MCCFCIINAFYCELVHSIVEVQIVRIASLCVLCVHYKLYVARPLEVVPGKLETLEANLAYSSMGTSG